MNSNKQNHILTFTKNDIDEYLIEFKKCILEGRYTISRKNRQENLSFIEKYNIYTKKEHEILLGLHVEDFCYATQNDHGDYSHEMLYVFCKQHDLDNRGNHEKVEIYIKVNMLVTRSGNLHSVVVSFHKKNFEITYLFR